ncbi:glutelin type-A 3-like [Malania oleifera]|uniref:glutelin type-A 3-like n=1 Tax=Malania oleifera TaxID=397392 RepID=UPI0025ADD8BA|nr:glutelin type-A 3-like [Malania oleifera]
MENIRDKMEKKKKGWELGAEMGEIMFEGEGGSYYTWSTSKLLPLLSESKVGAGRLVLAPRGFALPHYADSSKLGYVIQGCCGRAGMVFPNAPQEVVFNLKEGVVIPVPAGVVSWWYNPADSDSDLVILFLGETFKSHSPGDFTYFLETGARGILRGFSPKFISQACQITQREEQAIVNAQTGTLIVKLGEEKAVGMPQPSTDDVASLTTHKMTYDIDGAAADVQVKSAGQLTAVTEAKFPVLGEVGLSVSRERMCAGAMSAPVNAADGAVRVSYVVAGSGRVEMVGVDGERVVDAEVEAGHLWVVPRFFTVSKVAGDDGIETVTMATTPQPVYGELVGPTSLWNALSPGTLRASLDTTPELEELFMTKMRKSTVLIPPNN